VLGLLAARGHTEALRLLLDAGVDVNGRVDGAGRTPLLSAADVFASERAARMLSTMALLLARGADVNLTDLAGYTALAGAARLGDRERIALLLKWGADPNRRAVPGTAPRCGETPLFAAIRAASAESVRALLEAGASASVQSDSGLTPLACAKGLRKTRARGEIIALLQQSAAGR
jgi:ankyrin repeat protein